MDKSIQAGQIWKRKKDGVYIIIILSYDVVPARAGVIR